MDLIKYTYFPVDLAFDEIQKQHENNCSQLQTNTCKNYWCLLLNLERRQKSVYSTDKTFAVYSVLQLGHTCKSGLPGNH